MLPAPRQGRKGGKISSSPAIAQPASTPGTVSPGTLPGATAAAGLPADVDAETLEFNIEALMSSKRATSAGNTTVAAATTTTTTGESATRAAAGEDSAAATGTPVVTAAPDNVLKFDVNVIEQIGQGTVIGGNRTVRTDIHKPETSGTTVAKTVTNILDAAAESAKQVVDAQVTSAILDSIAESDVTIFHRAYESLKAAIAVGARVSGSMILVVVPRFFEIASTAESVRKLLSIDGAKLTVGELCGQNVSGDEQVRIWVTSSETAILYLDVQRSFAPFTHVVFPDLTQISPITSFLLWGTRERIFLRSANYDTTAPPLHLIISKEGSIGPLQQFFHLQKTVELQLTSKQEVTEISYDAASAFAELDVMEMDTDASSKFTGPHPKLVAHTTQMAVKTCTKLLSAASCPLSIHIFSAESAGVVHALQEASLPNTVVFDGPTPTEEVAADVLTKSHHIYVQHRILSFSGDANDGRGIHFVLDMGTSRRVAAPTKGESFIASSTSGWASKQEVSDHKAVLGYGCAGGYFQLYPPNVEATFPAMVPQCPISSIESALLQSGRVGMNSVFAGELTTPVDPESLELALGNLAEKGFIADRQTSTSLTFLGEMASRLPLDVDVAHFVINCCAAGLSEVGVVAASVCALGMPRSVGNSDSSDNGASDAANKRRETTLDARSKYAGDLTRLSDFFADVMLYLEWARLKVSGMPTEAFAQEISVSEQHLERIHVFSGFLREQLSDYSFIEDVCGDVAAVEKAVQSLKSHNTTLVFLEAVSFARRVFFVRNAGQINVRDRAAAPVFIRTAKKVVMNSRSVSAVPWEMGTALISTDLRVGPTVFTCSNVSVVNSSYLFATLLLLAPAVEYSKPVETADKGRVVYLGVTFNRQMKRFCASIEEAASILDFRESWNAAIGYLQALRTSLRPISHRRFELELKEEDRLFTFAEFYKTLIRTFTARATDFDISEYQGSFETDRIHYLIPKEPKTPNPAAEASDVAVMKQFRTGEAFKRLATVRNETPASLQQKAVTPPTAGFPAVTAATVFEDDDDDIEVIQESYFTTHGPIIDDDE